MKKRGYSVCRVNFCGADILFWPFGGVWFRDDPAAWPEFLERLIDERGVTDMLLFGDARPFHRAAIASARQRSVQVHVFEEGYFRPHWITMEKGGTNGWSSLPHAPAGMARLARRMPVPPEPESVAGGAGRRALFEMAAAVASAVSRPIFPRYRRHRPQRPLEEGIGWLRRFVSTACDGRRMVNIHDRLISSGRPYFLFPLQLPGDSQIKVHSPFSAMTDAVDHVLQSFRDHAPAECCLVVKRHPLDNAVFDFETYTRENSVRLGIGDRVVFLDGGHLPTLIRQSRGMITVNSTAGIQALYHQCPTLALGTAIYDLPGLTSRRRLDSFWRDPDGPDAEVFSVFRRAVMGATQINGNFYTPHGIRKAVAGALQRLDVDAPVTIEHAARSAQPLSAVAPSGPQFAVQRYAGRNERIP